jgi:RNA polymerase sigma-70 factor (ECF subfamily)
VGVTDDAERDASLVARLVEGDTAALAELYDRHADVVYRVAFRRLGDRHLAEEVLQDTYMTLWDRAELFDPAAGPLRAWLAVIARNRATDRLRALGRRPAALHVSGLATPDEDPGRTLERLAASGDLLGSGGPAPDPERSLDESETREQIRAALGALSDVERAVLQLGYYEELSQSEIASRLGWPLGTVKTRTRRALMHLREALVGLLGPDVAPPPGAGAASTVAVEGATDGAR